MDELENEVKELFRKIWNIDEPVTKTILWEYSVQKADAINVADIINDEMRKVEYVKNVAKTYHLSPKKRLELMNYVRSGEFTVEQYFRSGGRPEVWFYNTPPVKKVALSDRVLIVGTRFEVSKLWEEVERINKGENEYKYFPMNLYDELRRGETVYASDTGSFWKRFFKEKNFLDCENVSKPKRIISTGYIRDYQLGTGRTIEVKERLEEISREFKVNLDFIEPFHL